MTDTNGPPLLEVRDLRYRYGDRVAVDGVSFEARSGEVLGFLGPNGAGKTTMLSCVAGLRTGFDGTIHRHGEAFDAARRPGDRARLGLVPQEMALYDDLTGRENLEFFGRTQSLSGDALTQAVDRALSLAGLEDRAGDRVKAYSGGMKRRLNLAVGDLHGPDVLMLDEPTVGVDPQSRNHIFDCLESLVSDGRTIFYTTHYMEEAQRLCHRVAILHEGKLLALGTPAELAAESGDPEANLEEVFLAKTGRRLRD